MLHFIKLSVDHASVPKIRWCTSPTMKSIASTTVRFLALISIVATVITLLYAGYTTNRSPVVRYFVAYQFNAPNSVVTSFASVPHKGPITSHADLLTVCEEMSRQLGLGTNTVTILNWRKFD